MVTKDDHSFIPISRFQFQLRQLGVPSVKIFGSLAKSEVQAKLLSDPFHVLT